MLQAFGGLIFSSTYNLISRYILAKKHFEYKRYITLIYLFGAVLLLFGIRYFDLSNLTILSGSLILTIICTAIIGDLFFFHGLEHTRIEKVEPLYLCSWIFTVVFAVIIYPSERDILKVILALIAGITVVLVNVKKNHLKLDKYAFYILFAAFLLGIQNNIIKTLLEYHNAYTLNLLILIGGSLILPFFFKIKKRDFTRKVTPIVILAAIVTVTRWLLLYWSYKEIGIVFTSLIMTGAPILEIWGSKIFLKEKLHWRYMVGTVIIILCIVVSLIF